MVSSRIESFYRAPWRRAGGQRVSRAARGGAAGDIAGRDRRRFVIVQVVPGDPVRYMMGLQAEPDTVAALRHQLGLDATPWSIATCRGDRRTAARRFGISYTYRIPVGALWPSGCQVIFAAGDIACCCRPRSRSASDYSPRQARARRRYDGERHSPSWAWPVPNSGWNALGAVICGRASLGIRRRLSWVGGGILDGHESADAARDRLEHAAGRDLGRVLRGALIDTLHEDYIRTARANGRRRSALAVAPCAAQRADSRSDNLGMQFSFLLAGGVYVIIENVFFLPAWEGWCFKPSCSGT